MRELGAPGPHRVLGSSARQRQQVDALRRGEHAEARDVLALHIDEVRAWMIDDYLAGGLPGIPASDLPRVT